MTPDGLQQRLGYRFKTPALLAQAESGITGARFLDSMLAGYAVAAGLSRRFSSVTTPRGLRPSWLYAPFGATAAVARARGLEPDRAQIDGLRGKIVETFERQTSAFYTSGRMLDDGVIDPRDTRRVLGFVLSLFRRSDRVALRPLDFGVARP